jgi:hypothetical protein
MARFSGVEQATMFGWTVRQCAQVSGGAQKPGFRVILGGTSLLPFAVREWCPGRQTRHEFGQSQACEMGLNPSFFKAGAGGGEV